MIRVADELEHSRAVLADARYDLDAREIDGLGSVLLAETLYALVMVVAVPEEEIERFVDDAQATLTHIAAIHPSPRSWDLYLVLVVDRARYDDIREAFEADTRYARKLVVTGGRRQTERLLRPLLPLRAVPEIELTDPLRAVRDQLLAAGLSEDLVDTALSSFERTSEIRVR
jgi:hypothetical protein